MYFNLLVSPLVYSLELIRITQGAAVGAGLFYFSLVAYTVLFTASAIVCGGALTKTFALLGGTLIATLFYAIGLTLVMGGDGFDVGGNLLRLVLALAILRSAGRYSSWLMLEGPFLDRVARFGLTGVVIGVLIVWIANGLGASVYFGLSTEGAFPALAAGLMSGSPGTSIISGTAIFLGGKRGPILAAVLMLCLWMLLFRHRWALLLVVAVVGMTVAGSFGGLRERVVESQHPVVSRFSYFLATPGKIDWRLGTAGRNVEVEYVFQRWRERPLDFVFGAGAGGLIEVEGGTRSTVHVSPLALMFYYGVPLGGLLYALIWLVFAIKWRQRWALHNVRRHAVGLATFGLLVVSLSVFTILQNPLVWLFLGGLVGMSHRRNTETRLRHG